MSSLSQVEPDEDEPVPEDAEPDEIIDADTFVAEMQVRVWLTVHSRIFVHGFSNCQLETIYLISA